MSFRSATRQAIGLSLLLSYGMAASASERTLGAGMCDRDRGETATVAAIVDPVTLLLDSGREVRLAGVMPGPDAEDAIALLTLLSEGREVSIHAGGIGQDRYGRAYAQVFLTGDQTWLQAELVAAGLALVSGFAEDRNCLAELLMHERRAREQNAGLWQLRQPIDAWSPLLRNVPSRYELVEGRVVSIGRTERTVYLNFGNDWSVDLTVTIDIADAARFESEGVMFETLIGNHVRIRGWLEQWDGPLIRVDHPEQIEVLNASDGGGVSS